MTVYVDDMYKLPMGQFGRMKMSHMIADTVEELHAMADRIGIDRRWFQRNTSADHYDVAISKRVLAVEGGAVEITVRQCSAMCFRRRITGALGDPTTALDYLRDNVLAKWKETAA